jgi:predicted metal-dependent hydrolase
MNSIQLFIIITTVLVVILITYFMLSNPNMTYVKSNIDDAYYLVRNVHDKQEGANTLARIKQNMLTLSDFLHKNQDDPTYKKYVPYIQILHDKVRNIVINESTQDSIYTSYSVNKGEQIVFCLRARRLPHNLHDINLMMYVVLHETSHVACPIYDNHGPLFKDIFAFLVGCAMKLNLYKKIDFAKNNENYCGLMITDSIV